jgi:hypothetical protein
MVRVLRPGGAFLVTNRVGWEARLMPGRAFDRREFETMLAGLGLEGIETRIWQTYYDLVFATKASAGSTPAAAPAAAQPIDDLKVHCPDCGQHLRAAGVTLRCRSGHVFLWRDGSWDLMAGGRSRTVGAG